jgi:CheY-like chemotaxis protein/predicted DNA-binding transcriptional regulator AlpA
MDSEETLTARDVAQMCGVTSRTVTRWIKAGYFPGAWKAPGKTSSYHIPKAEVVAFIDRMSDEIDTQGREMEVLQRLDHRQAGKLFALIIEDDADAGAIFEFTLRAVGFHPMTVRTGQEALSIMTSMLPNLVVLDLHLPDMPGIDILQRIRTTGWLADVPVIVATAHPQMAEVVEEEADLVLIKPVRYRVLQDKAVELARQD